MSLITRFFDATGIPPLHLLIQPADYTITTWLLLGATIQCLLIALLPKNIAISLALLTLLYRFTKGCLIHAQILSNPAQSNVHFHRTTTKFPTHDGTPATLQTSEKLILMILNFSTTHPNGSFSPGVDEIGENFMGMWQDAERDRVKYGYLGNTPAMVSETDKGLHEYGTRDGDDKACVRIWITYWRDLEGLRAWASESKHHSHGWRWWEGGAKDRFRHIGIGHELYEVPAGNWYTIATNCPPWGLSHAKFPVRNVDDEGKEIVKFVSGIREAKGREWNGMYTRLGRKPPGVSQKVQ